jgi:zinc D-Ala-D-Ala dipeptidase
MTSFFGALETLRHTPIPDLAEAHRRRVGFRSHKVDLSHPLSKEPLVDIRTLGIDGINFYHRPDNPPYYERIPGSIPELLLRKSVAARLKGVDERLRACGLKLFVHDGYRPIEVQSYFHDTWMPARLREKQPGLSGDALTAAVQKYWAAPSHSETQPAPHSTGGATDLTLYKVQPDEPLHMGSLFDDVTAVAHTDYLETKDLDSYSEIEARHNRRLLYWVMREAGFANNPNEWWHFSWGDQMWARLYGEDAAVFGVASGPAA